MELIVKLDFFGDYASPHLCAIKIQLLIMSFRSLSDFIRGGAPEAEEGTTSFTGGEHSGLAVQNPHFQNRQGPPPVDAVRITVYANGFCLNEGAFRDVQDPVNAKFLADIKKGAVPAELAQRATDGSVSVALVDKSSERFELPREAAPLFAGAGQTLGGSSGAQLLTTQASVHIDESRPSLTLSVRFGNGQRTNQTFNDDHTIEDLYGFVEASTGTRNFHLMRGFPPKVLPKSSNTLKAAGLSGDSLVQKLL